MMTRLLSSLGAFGASYALFSYFGGGALPYAICAAFLAPLLSFALSKLPDRHHLPLLALLALLFLSLPLLVRDTFLSSLLSALIPLVDTLKEPYDIDMTAPLAKAIASPALAKGGSPAFSPSSLRPAHGRKQPALWQRFFPFSSFSSASTSA